MSSIVLGVQTEGAGHQRVDVGQPVVVTRLLKNQDDIGGAVAGFYGRDAGDKLTGLLKQHIMIAVDLIAAAKANDQARRSRTS